MKQIKITDANREYIASIETKIGENNSEQTIGSTSELNRVLELLKTRTRRNHSNNVIMLLIPKDEQIAIMAEYLLENPKATESDILKKATEISEA